jgi:hypothetical protein
MHKVTGADLICMQENSQTEQARRPVKVAQTTRPRQWRAPHPQIVPATLATLGGMVGSARYVLRAHTRQMRVRGNVRSVVVDFPLRKQVHLWMIALRNAPRGSMGQMEGLVSCALLASTTLILAVQLALKTALQARIHLLEAFPFQIAAAISASQDQMESNARRARQAPTRPVRDRPLAAAAPLVSAGVSPHHDHGEKMSETAIL